MKHLFLALAILIGAGLGFGRWPSPEPALLSILAPASGATNQHEIYLSEESTILKVEGQLDAQIDLFVYDGFGNLVAQSKGLRSGDRMPFTPLRAGTHRIVLRNLTMVPRDYC